MRKKRIICLVIIVVLLTGITALATYLIDSKDVGYDNEESELEADNVQDAIDELLERCDSGSQEYIVTYDAQNNTENITGNAVYGTLAANPTREGYYFIGWYDAATGGNKITSDTVIGSKTTVYAHWVEGTGSFSTDSWETIKTVVHEGLAEALYNVGDTKTVDLGTTYGNHTVRIANNSHYDCKVDDVELPSKTACGFVVEFADVITKREMGTTNSGGWRDSSMRSWLNNSSSGLLSYFPSNLRDIIATTSVVSGYEYGKSANYTTTDKLYFLASREVYKNGSSLDTVSATETRQLDYYNIHGLVSSGNGAANRSYAIKYQGNYSREWWFRSADSNETSCYVGVHKEGYSSSLNVRSEIGVSPAFRIE